MTQSEAKQILAAYRPGGPDAAYGEVAEALAFARQQPELQPWLERHETFQRAITEGLRNLPVPPELRNKILASRIVPFPRPAWARPWAWAAAAAAAILISIGTLWLWPGKQPGFEQFRARMVRTVLREYRMDIVTRSEAEVRRFLLSRAAPSDFALPAGLAQLPLAGAGVLSWQGKPVSMVCFELDQTEMVFLFVADWTEAPPAPGEQPALGEVHRLATAGWGAGPRAYLLAAPVPPEEIKRFL